VKIHDKLVMLVGFFLFSLVSGIPAVEAQSGTSELTVHSQYGLNEIMGYYTVLSQNGVVLETDFTPATFTVNDDEIYNVALHNFEDYEFLMWQDTGSAISNKDIAISTDADFIADYGNILDPSPLGTSELTVSTVNSSGDEIFGYWTVLYQNGIVLKTGFSPMIADLNNGDDYEVYVGDWDGVNFNHHEDGGELNPYPISINSNKEILVSYSEPEPMADLGLTVVGVPFLGNGVGDADFTITLVNNGPNTAENVIFDMTGIIETGFPTSSDISLTNVCSTFGDPGCIAGILNPGECLVKDAPPGSFGSTCNLGNIAPFTTITLEEHVDIKSGATGEMTVSASVSSDIADPNSVNDASSDTVNDPGS